MGLSALCRITMSSLVTASLGGLEGCVIALSTIVEIRVSPLDYIMFIYNIGIVLGIKLAHNIHVTRMYNNYYSYYLYLLRIEKMCVPIILWIISLSNGK